MGKNRIRESLIREVANVVVHEILIKHTNRPESVHSVESEAIEYRSNAEKISETYNWNAENKNYIKDKALKMIKAKLVTKYSDIEYSEQKVINKLNEIIDDII